MVYFLVYTSIFSPLIPITLIGINYKKFWNRTLLLFGAFTIMSFLTDLATITVVNGNNYFFLNIYALLEFALIGLLFLRIIKTRPTLNKLTFAGFYMLTLIIFLYNPYQFNDIGRAIEATYTISLSIIYFYSIYTNSESLFIEKSPLFWLVVGLFVYFSGSLFSFLLSNEILKQEIIMPDYSWAFHNMANIAKNVLFAVGFGLLKNDTSSGKQ
ncbi:hypothetical protein [Ekhidna sp. To15]|uniref:hypothetical protein n=1 Tax=Ekhidna sp. To15 TaxID=3395267 RepID=UPI003F527769